MALLSLVTLAYGGEGEITISRDVQPRVATRAPLMVDPNPRTSSPGAITYEATDELSDSDFAAITTGTAMSGLLSSGAHSSNPSSVDRLPQQHLPGMGATHRAGGQGSVGSQVNRSVQQGLRPLQSLGGR